MERVKNLVVMPLGQILFVVALVAIWGWGVNSAGWNDFVMGNPSLTWGYLKDWISDGTLLSSAISTFEVLVIGWFIGTLGGIALGTAVGLSTYVRKVLDPFLAFLNGTPRLILYPFLAIGLGFNKSSQVVLVALVIIIVVTTVVATGFQEVDRDLINRSRLSGASWFEVARDVHLMSLAGWIAGVTRITIGYAFQAAITSEFLGASAGLGHLIVIGESKMNINQIWAALVAVIIIAWLLELLLSRIEKPLLVWSRAT